MRKRVYSAWRAILTAQLAVLLIAACSSDATGPDRQPQPQPQPGELRVTVVPTAGSTGAVVLHVTGPAMSDPTGVGGATVFYGLSGSTLRAVVVGTSLAGEVLRFSVPDVRDAPDYAVSVQQVAGNDNQPMAVTGVLADVAPVP